MGTKYLDSAIKQFSYYKTLGDRTFAQLSDEQLFWRYNAESNTIAGIVAHLSGNMLSRWTDFLTTDGEKPWRDRDKEFDDHLKSRQEMLSIWEQGWAVLLTTLSSLNKEDLETTVLIRNEPHTVLEAINRQLAHYPYHIGQIVFIGKLLAAQWQSLTIPKGGSEDFNRSMFR